MLLEFLNEKKQKKGSFIAAKLDTNSVSKLLSWMKNNHIPHHVSAEELHVTIAYDEEKKIDAKAETFSPKLKLDKSSFKFELFNNGDVLVLRFDSKKLEHRHKELKDKFKFKWKFKSYKPHITLSYDFHGKISDFKLPDFDLFLDKEIKTDYEDDKSDDKEEIQENSQLINKYGWINTHSNQIIEIKDEHIQDMVSNRKKYGITDEELYSATHTRKSDSIFSILNSPSTYDGKFNAYTPMFNKGYVRYQLLSVSQASKHYMFGLFVDDELKTRPILLLILNSTKINDIHKAAVIANKQYPIDVIMFETDDINTIYSMSDRSNILSGKTLSAFIKYGPQILKNIKEQTLNDESIFLHGTSFKNYESIMKHGLLPNYENKEWPVGYKSLEGIYLTKNPMVAQRVAKNNGIIVVVKFTRIKSMAIDEDHITENLIENVVKFIPDKKITKFTDDWTVTNWFVNGDALNLQRINAVSKPLSQYYHNEVFKSKKKIPYNLYKDLLVGFIELYMGMDLDEDWFAQVKKRLTDYYNTYNNIKHANSFRYKGKIGFTGNPRIMAIYKINSNKWPLVKYKMIYNADDMNIKLSHSYSDLLFLKESKIIKLSLKPIMNKEIIVYQNPFYNEVVSLLNKFGGAMRGIITEDYNTLYVWDAHEMTHGVVGELLNLTPPVDQNIYLFITKKGVDIDLGVWSGETFTSHGDINIALFKFSFRPTPHKYKELYKTCPALIRILPPSSRVNEAKVEKIHNPYSNTNVNVYVDPTGSEVKLLVERYKELRGLLIKNKIYIWNAYDSEHMSVEKYLDVFIDEGNNCSFYIIDKSISLDSLESVWAKRIKMIGDIGIGFYSSDMFGNHNNAFNKYINNPKIQYILSKFNTGEK